MGPRPFPLGARPFTYLVQLEMESFLVGGEGSGNPRGRKSEYSAEGSNQRLSVQWRIRVVYFIGFIVSLAINDNVDGHIV